MKMHNKLANTAAGAIAKDTAQCVLRFCACVLYCSGAQASYAPSCVDVSHTCC
jgi:hypothetical protein